MAVSENKNFWHEEKVVLRDSAFTRARNVVRDSSNGITPLPSIKAASGIFASPAGQQTFKDNAAIQYYLQNSQQAEPEPVVAAVDEQTDYDPQTSAYSLNFLLEQLQAELNHAVQNEIPLSIMVIAFTSLKTLERKYGLLAYSLALKTVVKALQDCCGPLAIVGRYTDDRFLIMMPEQDLETTAIMSKHLCDLFAALVVPCQHSIKIPASIGYASCCPEIQDMESLIAVADLGADIVTQKGGNGFCYAPETFD